MKTLILGLLGFMASLASLEAAVSLYDIPIRTIEHKETTLAPYKGKVMLIVNVASKCGFTSQYEGLETLYQKYKERGLVVLGFPCNQFASQEPLGESEILNFCRVNYGVSFPMFEKIDVNGDNAHPLYKHLKSEQPGFLGSESIKWNFTKFLVDQEGRVLKRYGSTTTPESLKKPIEALLEL